MARKRMPKRVWMCPATKDTNNPGYPGTPEEYHNCQQHRFCGIWKGCKRCKGPVAYIRERSAQ